MANSHFNLVLNYLIIVPANDNLNDNNIMFWYN
jgi:hypothetical protein